MQTLRTMEMKGQVIRLLKFLEGRLVEVLKQALIPRYVRVNSILGTTESVIENFVSRGFTLSDPFSSSK